jgi:hypothetical protein
VEVAMIGADPSDLVELGERIADDAKGYPRITPAR